MKKVIKTTQAQQERAIETVEMIASIVAIVLLFPAVGMYAWLIKWAFNETVMNEGIWFFAVLFAAVTVILSAYTMASIGKSFIHANMWIPEDGPYEETKKEQVPANPEVEALWALGKLRDHYVRNQTFQEAAWARDMMKALEDHMSGHPY